jgi:hypothetical protein
MLPGPLSDTGGTPRLSEHLVTRPAYLDTRRTDCEQYEYDSRRLDGSLSRCLSC